MNIDHDDDCSGTLAIHRQKIYWLILISSLWELRMFKDDDKSSFLCKNFAINMFTWNIKNCGLLKCINNITKNLNWIIFQCVKTIVDYHWGESSREGEKFKFIKKNFYNEISSQEAAQSIHKKCVFFVLSCER